MLDVLVVDDNDFILKTIEKLLGDEMYRVQSFTDPMEALFCALEYEFDLIITDIMMPMYNGMNFIRELRRRGVTAPVIGITAENKDLKNTIANFADYYTDALIIKPFNQIDFVATIDQFAQVYRAKH
jgi:DNA-binding response OmpR family regulator